MKKVYLVLCNGVVSDEAYSTVDGDKAYYISYATKSYTLVEVKVIGFNITVCEIWGVVCKTDSYPFTLPIDEVYFNKLQAEKEIDKLNNTKTLKQG